MSTYVLDTDVLSLLQHGHPAVFANAFKRSPLDLAITVITVQEQLDGWHARLNLTKDLDYLPSLVKYGVSGTLACHLFRLKLSREVASRISEWYIKTVDLFNDDPMTFIDVPNDPSLQAQQVIHSLTEADITSLNFDDSVIQRIKEIAARYERHSQQYKEVSIL